MKKPLTNTKDFLKRFNNFKDGEFRSIEIISPTVMIITLSGQDNARDFDWISMKFELNGIDDARLIDNSKLSLVDMSDGISIVQTKNKFIFGIGKYDTVSNIKDSSCFIASSTIKYEEGLF
jgi:hypothetical protein